MIYFVWAFPIWPWLCLEVFKSSIWRIDLVYSQSIELFTQPTFFYMFLYPYKVSLLLYFKNFLADFFSMLGRGDDILLYLTVCEKFVSVRSLLHDPSGVKDLN